MGLWILAMRQRMHGAAGSNEEPLRGIDPRLCKQQEKKRFSVTSHDPRIDQVEAIRISIPHPCRFPSAYLIFYVHHFTRWGRLTKESINSLLDASSLVQVERRIEYGYLLVNADCLSISSHIGDTRARLNWVETHTEVEYLLFVIHSMIPACVNE